MLQDSVIKLHQEHKIVYDELNPHDTIRCGSPDLFVNPRHVRKRLQVSRHLNSNNVRVDGSRKRNTIFCPSTLTGDLKTENDRQLYNEAISIEPESHERFTGTPPVFNTRQTLRNVLTPPLSNEDNSFEQNQDQIIEEIIIDLDDELKEDERITGSHGRDSPDYTPNEDIRVSVEDQRIFFNRKQKVAKIKTEARKEKDRQYINQVRQLKEQASTLRRLSSNRGRPGQTATVATHTVHNGRVRGRLASEPDNISRSNTDKSTSVSGTNAILRQSTTLGRSRCNTVIASSSNTNSIADSNPNSSHVSLSVFDQLISSACSNVQKQKEKDVERQREVNSRLLMQANFESNVENIAQRVDAWVDKYVGANTSRSLVAAALENHHTTYTDDPHKNSHSDEEVISINSTSSSPYRAATPPYKAATPPSLEELEAHKSRYSQKTRQIGNNVCSEEVVCLSSDDENIVSRPNDLKEKTLSTRPNDRAKNLELPQLQNVEKNQRTSDNTGLRKGIFENSTKKPERKESFNKWERTNFGDDKTNDKFKRLMGIKSAASTVGDSRNKHPSAAASVGDKSTTRFFQEQESQYERARAITHTQRGLGLGFSGAAQPEQVEHASSGHPSHGTSSNIPPPVELNASNPQKGIGEKLGFLKKSL